MVNAKDSSMVQSVTSAYQSKSGLKCKLYLAPLAAVPEHLFVHQLLRCLGSVIASNTDEMSALMSTSCRMLLDIS